jgi:hypothetical protein
MHTSVCVCGRGGRVDRSVVVGLGLCRREATEAVHESPGVVPVHPGRGHVFDIGEVGQGAVAERGVVADALGLVQADRGLGERVVESGPDGADRGRQDFQE